MTRELKLALIVGFSLVLFVTVLVSDHLSRARRAELPQVVTPASLTSMPTAELRATHEPARTPAPVTPKPAPIDSGSPFGAPTSQIAGAQPTPQTHPNAGPAAPAPAPASDTYAMGPLAQAVERGERGVLAAEGAHLDNPVVLDQTPRRDGRMDVKLVNNNTTIAPPPDKPQPTPGPQAEPKPVTAKIPEYAVEEGDTLYELSKKFYKDPKHWKALQAYNKGRLGKDGSPRAGASILVPPIDVLLGKPATPVTEVAAGANPPAPGIPALAKTDTKQDSKSAQAKAKVYKVQKDDTLTSIAQRMLGSHRRVNDLIKANPSVDPENMKVGTELRIPA